MVGPATASNRGAGPGVQRASANPRPPPRLRAVHVLRHRQCTRLGLPPSRWLEDDSRRVGARRMRRPGRRTGRGRGPAERGQQGMRHIGRRYRDEVDEIHPIRVAHCRRRRRRASPGEMVVEQLEPRQHCDFPRHGQLPDRWWSGRQHEPHYCFSFSLVDARPSCNSCQRSSPSHRSSKSAKPSVACRRGAVVRCPNHAATGHRRCYESAVH